MFVLCRLKKESVVGKKLFYRKDDQGSYVGRILKQIQLWQNEQLQCGLPIHTYMNHGSRMANL